MAQSKPTKYSVDAVYDSSEAIYEQAVSNYTESNDTLSSVGYLEKLANVNYTENNDTLTAIGNAVNSGTITYTEDDDTLTSVSLLFIQANSIYLEDDDSFSSDSQIIIQSYTSYTEDSDSSWIYIVLTPYEASTGTGSFLYTINSGSSGSPFTNTNVINNLKPYEET